MKIYRIMGFWLHTIKSKPPVVETNKTWPMGLLPFTPLYIDEDVFKAYMNYSTRVARWTFQRIIAEEVHAFQASAQSEINAKAQGRKPYVLLLPSKEVAIDMFKGLHVVETDSPDIKYNVLEEMPWYFHWGVFGSHFCWMYQFTGTSPGNEYFKLQWWEEAPLCWSSRDHHVARGWPDRVCLGNLFQRWKVFDGVLHGEIFFRAAAVYKGMASQVSPDTWRLHKADRKYAMIVPPLDVWKSW